MVVAYLASENEKLAGGLKCASEDATLSREALRASENQLDELHHVSNALGAEVTKLGSMCEDFKAEARSCLEYFVCKKERQVSRSATE